MMRNSAGSSDEDDDCYGPSLPPHLMNKSLPKANNSNNSQDKNKEETEAINSIKDNTTSIVIGPILPSTAPDSTLSVPDEKEGIISEECQFLSDDEDESDIGPFPPGDPRGDKIIPANLSKGPSSNAPKREEWMLVPPKNKTISEAVGLTPSNRKFLGRTPDEVVQEEDEEVEEDFMDVAKREFNAKLEKEKEERMNEILSKSSNGKEKESLLSLHRKRKKTSDDGPPKERRPFDRDEDLKVGGLSKEERDKFIKKTSELNSRFKGGSSKFL